MKKLLIILVVTAAIGLSSWQIVQSQDVAGPMEESQIIVAEYGWNGTHEISLATLNAEIAALPEHKQKGYQSKAGKLIFLEDFINQKLILLAAAEKGFDKEGEFQKKADDYKHQLMVERLTEMEVDDKIAITEERLRQYYEENKDTYVDEEKVRATCITVFDKELAQKTLEEIQAGKDILDAAKELGEEGVLTGPGSNPGDLGDTGFFARYVSARAQAFVDAIFEMEVGEMTEEVFEQDVEEDTYYMVFRKEEHQPKRQQTFEEVRPRLEYPLKRQMKRDRILTWLEVLTAQGKLKTYPELLPPPVVPEEEDPENEIVVDTQTTMVPETAKDPENEIVVIAEKLKGATVLLAMEDANGQSLGLGSGFFVRTNQIATNFHVIEGAARGTAKRVEQETTYNIEGFTAMDESHDLVVLQVSASDVQPLPFGDSDTVKTGEEVYTVGNPKGLEGAFSAGHISNVRGEGANKIIQFTAEISPGSSGGPLVNRQGQVIGVATMNLEGGQNLNFAIPSNYLKALLARLGPAKPLSQAKTAESRR